MTVSIHAPLARRDPARAVAARAGAVFQTYRADLSNAEPVLDSRSARGPRGGLTSEGPVVPSTPPKGQPDQTRTE